MGQIRLHASAGLDRSETIRVDIYGIRGEKVLSAELAGKQNYEISLLGHPAGIYLVHILAGKYYAALRIIRQE